MGRGGRGESPMCSKGDLGRPYQIHGASRASGSHLRNKRKKKGGGGGGENPYFV